MGGREGGVNNIKNSCNAVFVYASSFLSDNIGVGRGGGGGGGAAI